MSKMKMFVNILSKKLKTASGIYRNPIEKNPNNQKELLSRIEVTKIVKTCLVLAILQGWQAYV